MPALLPLVAFVGLVALDSLAPLPALGQATGSTGPADHLVVTRDDGSVLDLPIRHDRGYAVIADAGLMQLGWTVDVGPDGVGASLEGRRIQLALDTPFFRWDDDLLQLVRPPYSDNGAVWLPVQFFLDFLPARMPDRYSLTEGGELSVRTGEVVVAAQTEVEAAPVQDTNAAVSAAVTPESLPAPARSRADQPAAAEATDNSDPTWGLVVIDPGHGGRDPGAIGPGGRREKDIALSIGRALARELGRRDGLEVRMTRDRDQLIPIWERGHMATEWKQDRPALFISIHANSLPDRSSVRGFETYFLSEARTEHEARVAENENAPFALRDDDVEAGAPDLDFILRDLRNRDHLRWSSALAEEVQRGMEAVHPGPNRGVKQAPFAVITNALMPAVLVEVGFVTNPNEERVLSRGEFQRDIAVAIAGSIDRFFERYPRAGASGGESP